MSQVRSYTSWQPLEEIIVGRVYTPQHFSFIKNSQVRDQLTTLLMETTEDLDNLQRVLEGFGVKVQRPTLISVDEFQAQALKLQSAPLPPLTPRDWQITLGDRILRLLNVPEMNSILETYERAQPGSIMDPHRGGYNAGHPLVHAVASCIVRCGRDVFFDNSEFLTTQHMEWIRDNVLDDRYRVHRCQTNGHGDAVFAILKPGVIISSMHDADINYRESFPGWEVYKVWDASIFAAQEVGKFKYENFNGRWYVQQPNPSEEFAQFVDTYLKKWTGFVSETVFDVNCLVVDEQHVIFSSHNQGVFDFCRRHGIEPIVVPQRHKYFFDSGISCCTQDVRRRGELESYL